MANEYADPDVVRRFATAVTTDVISDADINLVSSTIVDPVIDAELSGLGAPFTDPVPAYVVAAASMMAIAVIFDDRYYQTGAESDWGQRKWARGMELLERIKTGKAIVSGVTRPRQVIVSDPTDDKASTAVFVGDETTWAGRTEEKASS